MHTHNPIARILLLICLALTTLGNTTPATARAPAEPSAPLEDPVALTTEEADSLVLSEHMLYWKQSTGCAEPSVEFPPYCRIRSRPAYGLRTRTVFEEPVFSGPNSFGEPSSNLAANSSHVFWANRSNQVVRVSRHATLSTTAELVTARQLVTTTINWVAADNTHVFWAENLFTTTVSARRGYLYRKPLAGGTAELMEARNAVIHDLKADGSGGAYYIAAVFGEVLHHSKPAPGSGFVTQFAGVAFVQSYALNANTVFVAHETSGRVRISSVPRTSFEATPAILHTSETGNPIARSMAADAANVYWHEARLGSGPINRLPVGGGAPAALTPNLISVNDLVSDGRHLFWGNAGGVFRLSTTATPVTLDLAANEINLEVIQVIQRPANDVPLVEGKETFVRAYGRILASSLGLTSVNVFPLVTLVGTRDGVPLPESPLRPLAPAALRNTPINRNTLNDGFLFRLPASWASGNVQLRAEVNPRRVLNETNYANNSNTQTVTFNRRNRPCVDVIPLATTTGTIGAWNPGLQQHFARGESVWPVSSFRQIWRGGPPHQRPNVPRLVDPLGIFGEGPYNLNSDFELNYLMFNMAFAYSLWGWAEGCTVTAIAPDASRFGISAGEAFPVMMFLRRFDGEPRNYPRGGLPGLAHELGHTYGQSHVDCGGPAGVNTSFPYPPCQLDNVGPNQHIGFDVISRQVITPTEAGDIMSYAGVTWSSDYTYKRLFNKVGGTLLAAASAPEPSIGPARPEATEQTLVSGMISGTGSSAAAILGFSYQISGTALTQVASRISATTQISTAYELRAYDASNALLSSSPLNVSAIETEGGAPFALFFNLISSTPTPARLEVVRVGQGPIGNRTAGANAPTVNITSPTAGSTVTNTLNLTWAGNDPDGDALLYTVRYSNDNGATWIPLGAQTTATSLSVDMTTGLPGGANALVQVMASDGVHSGSAIVGPFSVQRHAPQANIMNDAFAGLDLNATAGALQSETVVLRGRGYDAEDGTLGGNALQWQLTGQITRTGDGEQLTLIGLPPGTYEVTLTATDSDAQTSTARTKLTISPKRVFDGAAPAFDGVCDDATYAADLDPINLRYSTGITGDVADARFVHVPAESAVYVCFAGLLPGTASEANVGVWIDPDNSGGSSRTANDFGLFVRRNGVVFSVRGNGFGGVQQDALPDGVTARIYEDDASTQWSAELRIDDAKLGGWNKLVRMQAAHFGRNSTNDETGWPSQSERFTPDSWGLTALGQLPQSISFPALSDRSLNQSPVAVSASTTSGLPIGFSSLTPSICTVEDATVTLLTPGVCTVRAAQPGNASYSAATSVERSFTVSAIASSSRKVFLPFVRK
jgi:hypothetical protein